MNCAFFVSNFFDDIHYRLWNKDEKSDRRYKQYWKQENHKTKETVSFKFVTVTSVQIPPFNVFLYHSLFNSNIVHLIFIFFDCSYFQVEVFKKIHFFLLDSRALDNLTRVKYLKFWFDFIIVPNKSTAKITSCMLSNFFIVKTSISRWSRF